MAQRFAELLRAHSLQVAKLEGAQADEFLRLLNHLREQVAGRLIGIAPGDATLDAFRLKQIAAETEAAIRTLQLKAAGQYGKAQETVAEMAVSHIEDELEHLSQAFDVTPIEVSLDAAKVLADPAQGLLADHFETSVARYGGELLNGVRQRLFVALRTGDSVAQVAQEISSMRGPLGQVGRSSGERLARTEVSHAYGAAQHKGLAEASHTVKGLKKVWLHVASFLCATCGPLHGTERPLDGTWTLKSGKKTRKIAHPPGHPNCTCRVSAMKPSWRAGMEKLGYLEPQEGDDEPGKAEL